MRRCERTRDAADSVRMSDDCGVRTAQEAFEILRAHHLRPEFSALGFKVRSRKMWLRGNQERGWVVLTAGGSRHNKRTEGQWSIDVWAWPPGTWEWATRRGGSRGGRPDSPFGPLYAGPDRVLGFEGDPRPDVVTLVAGMSDAEITEAARALLDYTRVALSWVEELLDSDQADEFTWTDHVLGAAETTKRWTPSRLALLDHITICAQRGVWGPAWYDVTRWRAVAGLDPAPLPTWHHPLMQPDTPHLRFGSPRSAFVAGHGRSVDIRAGADDSRRPSCPEDFPDDGQVAMWRRAANTIPDRPVPLLPDWLPWIEWLHRDDVPTSTLKSLWKRLHWGQN